MIFRRKETILFLLGIAKRPLSAFEISSATKCWFVYSVLIDLERSGAIEATWGTGPFPRRMLYSLKAVSDES